MTLQREFVPILNLFSLLYPDRDPLPPPNPTQLAAVLDTAMASIWVVYSSRVSAMLMAAKQCDSSGVFRHLQMVWSCLDRFLTYSLPRSSMHYSRYFLCTSQCVCACRWLSEQSEAPPLASSLANDHTVALLLSVCKVFPFPPVCV